jgi:hypothetical protein
MTVRTTVRVAMGVASAIMMIVMLAPTAFAQPRYNNPPTVLPTVERAGNGAGAGAGAEAVGGASEGIAFTGFRLTVWMALLVALVALGLVAFWAGRRRAATARHFS